jgi:phosphatidylglycerol:prolipoprotein diacylglycerol transferase
VHPTLFTLHLFGRELPYSTYGALLALSFGITLLITWWHARPALTFERAVTLGLWSMAGTWAGGRLLHVLTVTDETRILDGGGAGFAYYGGFLGTLLTIAAYSRVNGLPPLRVADGWALGVSVALLPGRLACWFAGCCWGRPIDSPLPHWLASDARWPAALSATFTDPESVAPLHVAVVPTQLIMAFSALPIAAILFGLVRPRLKADGELLGCFLILHAFMRGSVEFLRDDPRGAWFGGYVTTSQLGALAAIAAGVGLLSWIRRP